MSALIIWFAIMVGETFERHGKQTPINPQLVSSFSKKVFLYNPMCIGATHSSLTKIHGHTGLEYLLGEIEMLKGIGLVKLKIPQLQILEALWAKIEREYRLPLGDFL